MIVAYLIVALLAAASAIVFLWPTLGIAAFAVAPFVASFAVVAVASLIYVLGAGRTRGPAEVPADPVTPP